MFCAVAGDKISETGPVNGIGTKVAPFLLAIYMLFTNILLLNLLIAIFKYVTLVPVPSLVLKVGGGGGGARAPSAPPLRTRLFLSLKADKVFQVYYGVYVFHVRERAVFKLILQFHWLS